MAPLKPPTRSARGVIPLNAEDNVNSGAILQAVNLHYGYGDGAMALQGASCEFPKGGFTLLLGRNGSGKTTLLHHLNRLLAPQQGTVIFKGRPLGSYPQREIHRAIGLMFQDPNDQLFGATVFEDVAFGPRNLGSREPEVSESVRTILDDLKIAHLAERPVHRLSFGQKRRVALAGVLAMNPEVILLDEPTAGLDPEGCEDLFGLLRVLNDRGITVIMATQELDAAVDYAREVTVLADGRVIATGDPATVLQDRDLLESAGLRQPRLTRFFATIDRQLGLGSPPYPVTMKGAAEAATAWLDGAGNGEVPWEPGAVYVIGAGPGSPDYITPIARRLVMGADILVGGRRLLSLFTGFRGEKKEVGRDLDEVVAFIANHPDKRVAVVVSGDPGLFSLLVRLLRSLPRERLRAIPGISSAQLAFARALLPWHNAKVISFHGRPERAPGERAAALKEALSTSPVVAVLTDQGFPPEAIARLILELGMGDKLITVADSLSHAEERVITGKPEEIALQSGFQNAVVIIADGE